MTALSLRITTTGMTVKKILTIILGLALTCSAASAQTTITVPKQREKYSGSISGKARMEEMITPKVDAKMEIPGSYKDFKDENFDELDQSMKEREWTSEDTAWKRACQIDTRKSYERYISMYPQGAHIADASCRLVDKKVDETLANAHEKLPNIKLVEPDETSPTSILVIKNNTGYPLSVYCSGSDSKSIVIPVDGKREVTLYNGEYKLAATVPPAYIHPFAGQTEFYGGRYEIGFWVVVQ